jgi:hypothetical protein
MPSVANVLANRMLLWLGVFPKATAPLAAAGLNILKCTIHMETTIVIVAMCAQV